MADHEHGQRCSVGGLRLRAGRQVRSSCLGAPHSKGFGVGGYKLMDSLIKLLARAVACQAARHQKAAGLNGGQAKTEVKAQHSSD